MLLNGPGPAACRSLENDSMRMFVLARAASAQTHNRTQLNVLGAQKRHIHGMLCQEPIPATTRGKLIATDSKACSRNPGNTSLFGGKRFESIGDSRPTYYYSSFLSFHLDSGERHKRIPIGQVSGEQSSRGFKTAGRECQSRIEKIRKA
jgi:hypothetical protein